MDSLAEGRRPIDVVAQTYARLVQDARAHYGDGREQEAFLYYVIALDHLLGEDGKNTSTVADRSSVLSHRLHARSFVDETVFVRRIYDARSRLVHSGSPPTSTNLHEAEALATAVLWAIVRVVTNGSFEDRSEWLTQVDSLAHVLRGDPDLVTQVKLDTVGAAADFRAASPPQLNDRHHSPTN